MKNYRVTRARIRQQERQRDEAVAAYYGKDSLVHTYELLGIENDYLRGLKERVRKRKVAILHRSDNELENET
jgi:hypothetical protein